MTNFLKLSLTAVACLVMGLVTVPAAMANNSAKAMGEFPVVLQTGELQTLDQIRQGRPVYIFFLGTWCHYYTNEIDPVLAENCRTSRKQMLTAYETYGEDILFVGLVTHMWDTLESVAAFDKQFNIPFILAYDEGGNWMRQYSIRDFPSHFILDKDGTMVYRTSGVVEDLNDKLAKLLAPNKSR